MSCLHFGGYVSADVSPPLSFSSPKKSDSKVYRLRKMSMSPYVKLRMSVAGNPMTDEETLRFLGSDLERSVRSWVLRNPAVSRELLLERQQVETEPALLAFIAFALSR